MPNEYEWVMENIRRLDEADKDLQRQIKETESTLRGEFIEAVHASEDRISHRIDGIDEHLTLQDQYLIGRKIDWRKTLLTLVIGAITTVIAFSVLHFGLHVG